MASSSVKPEHGVATAAEILAFYAEMPTRDTDAGGFVSFLRTQDEVDALCDKYGVPKEFTARPAGDLRANSTPPPGSICVYARALEAGMRVPLHGFFREVLAHFGIAPAQLTPNGWRFMEGFLALCRSSGVPPSLAVFLRFFNLAVIDYKHEKRWYFFRSRDSVPGRGLRFTGMPCRASKSIMGWKHHFFFLSSPEPWHCAVEWGEPSMRSFRKPPLTDEENKSVVKLLRAHGGAAVDLTNLLPATCPRRRYRLRHSNLAAAMITTASPPSPPPPSSTRMASCSKGMDPSVDHMMKTMMAEKAAAQASPSARKRTWEEAKVLPQSSVRSPPPRYFPSGHEHDGHTTDWEEAAGELLQGAVTEPLGKESSGDAQTANYVIELEEKLLAREREAAALREQLEESKAELAAAKQAAEAEAVKAKAELAAALAETVKLAAAKRATETELAKANTELAAANRATVAELAKTKGKLAAAEAELESAKAAAAVQELLASEENARRRAELALEGYELWRGRHAPAGHAA